MNLPYGATVSRAADQEVRGIAMRAMEIPGTSPSRTEMWQSYHGLGDLALQPITGLHDVVGAAYECRRDVVLR